MNVSVTCEDCDSEVSLTLNDLLIEVCSIVDQPSYVLPTKDTLKSLKVQDAFETYIRQRYNRPYQDVQIRSVWCYVSTSKDNKDIFRQLVKNDQAFDNVTDCAEYLRRMITENERQINLFILGDLSPELVDRVHDWPIIAVIHMDACSTLYNPDTNDPLANDAWYDKHPKVSRLTELSKINDQVTSMISEGQYGDFISVNYFNRSENSDRQATHTSHEDNSLYYQLFIEALLSICDEDATSSMDLYLDYCKETYVHGNEQLLTRIRDFVTSYESEHAIWWYTKEPFVYNLLNHALRLQDFDALITMSFLVRDVHTYLNEHRHPLSIGQPILHFYRGQAISRKEFGKMRDNIGKIVAINSFLSTSKNRDVAIFFAASSNRFDERLQPVLLEIIVDPSRTLHPKAFADISRISSMNEAEVEILFSMGSFFRIMDVIALNVESYGELWSVQLQLCDDRLDQVWLSMKSEIQNDGSFCQIGQVLNYIGEDERARRLYLYVLNDLFPKAVPAEPVDNHPIETWYVGSLFHASGQNEKALPFLDKALESQMKESDENNDEYYLQLYDIYAERGDVLQKLNRTDSALHDYESALNIARKKFGDEDNNTLIAWMKISKCYKNMKKYSEALHSYNICLGIVEKILPLIHPERASLHSSIGCLYADYEEYQKALVHFEKCLEIKLSIGLSNRSLAETYYNIGFTQCGLKEFTVGLENLKRAFDIFQKCFDNASQEPTVIRAQNAIILAQELLRLQIHKQQVLVEMLDHLDGGSGTETDNEEENINAETNVTDH